MQPSEVSAMCAYIAAAKPSHKLDDIAAKAWTRALADVPVEDARVVVDNLIASQAWIEPHDIVKAVRAIRAKRLEAARFVELVPNTDPADAVAYRAEQLALRDEIASGRMSRDEVDEYAAGGVRITPGPPHRPAGEQLQHVNLANALRSTARWTTNA